MPPKKTTRSHFSVDECDPFVLTDHSFKVVIRGRPLVWKRVGWRYGGTFTPSKAKQVEFCKVVRSLFYINRRPIIDFGDADLEASIQFCLPPPVHSGKITSPPDLDNLLKFIFDSFQGTFYTNDSTITKLRDVEKSYDDRYGGQGYTVVYLGKRVIEIN
jgi:Holliday junction resolvase RusA-like endonuclease